MPSRKRKASTSTHDTFPAKKTLRMVLPEESTTTALSSSLLASFPLRSDNTYATLTCLSHQLSRSLYSKEKPQQPSQDLTAHPSSRGKQTLTVHSKITQGLLSPRHKAGPMVNRFPRAVQPMPNVARPARYMTDLCPLPSPRRPHILASERLQHWIPLHGRETAENAPSTLSPEDVCQIAIVMGKSWEESTLATYGSGLLNVHMYCDQKGIPEDKHVPASPLLINAFISSLAGTYSGSTIDNYVYGIWAWHILHGVRWQMDTTELEALLRAAAKTAPVTSKRKKRVLYTLDFILAIRGQLNLGLPCDAAVYSCLTTTFYAAARLGEFTVPNLNAFQWDAHVKPSVIRTEYDWNGHLFSYLKDSRFCPLTKTEFIRTVAAAARSAGLDPRQGHGIHIGSTLEYLLRGTPFKVMKVKGRWASDAFLVYLTKHAQILTPYMQAVPEVHKNFIRITMPKIQR